MIFPKHKKFLAGKSKVAVKTSTLVYSYIAIRTYICKIWSTKCIFFVKESM